MSFVAPRATFFALLMLVLLAGTSSAAEPVEVTTCGQVFANGYLSADLDCSGYHDPVTIPEWIGKLDPPTIESALVLLRGGRLDLRGHTLIGNARGVYCMRSCRIIGGGGTITGGTSHNIDSDYGQHVQVEGLTLTGALQNGIWTRFKLTVRDSVIRDNPGRGIFVERNLTLIRTTITNNGDAGIAAVAGVKLEDADVSGNCTLQGTACGFGCADVIAGRKPRLKRSTCGLSRGPDCTRWGVCSGDAP